MPMSPRLLRPVASSLDPDAAVYLNAVAAADGEQLEPAVRKAVNDFITGCKADGIWDAIKSSCILAGARTLAGALVPLKPLGPELWSVSTPTIFDGGYGATGSWAGSTMSVSGTGTDSSFPRFQFSVPLSVGGKYDVTGRLSGDISQVSYIRLATSGNLTAISYDSSTGIFSGTGVTAAAAVIQFLFDGTDGAADVTIEELSIRQNNAPTNNNFVSGDYNRETGLVGDGSTTYLDSNRNNNADPQDSVHHAIWVASAATTNSVPIGAGFNLTGATRLATNYTSSQTVARIRQAAAMLTINAVPLSGSFFGYRRSASDAWLARINGSDYTDSDSSETPFDGDVFVFADNNNGSLAGYSDARLAFYSIGESLDLAALDARVSALITAIGAAI